MGLQYLFQKTLLQHLSCSTDEHKIFSPDSFRWLPLSWHTALCVMSLWYLGSTALETESSLLEKAETCWKDGPRTTSQCSGVLGTQMAVHVPDSSDHRTFRVCGLGQLLFHYVNLNHNFWVAAFLKPQSSCDFSRKWNGFIVAVPRLVGLSLLA